jgi:hypothetical protein
MSGDAVVADSGGPLGVGQHAELGELVPGKLVGDVEGADGPPGEVLTRGCPGVPALGAAPDACGKTGRTWPSPSRNSAAMNEKLHSQYERALGASHPLTETVLKRLGSNLRALGRKHEGDSLLRMPWTVNQTRTMKLALS